MIPETESPAEKFINKFWPKAFKNADTRETETGTLEHFFIVMSERYHFDHYPGIFKQGWYQADTKQDGWYYGNWCNPELLQIVSYIEGDIYFKQCHTVAQFEQTLVNDECKVDDHDKRFLTVLYGTWRPITDD